MPYSKINPNDMILRDHLAYDRTVLANERSLLAYIRTSITLLAAGGSLVKLFPDEKSMVYFGIVLLTIDMAASTVGVWRLSPVCRNVFGTFPSTSTPRFTHFDLPSILKRPYHHFDHNEPSFFRVTSTPITISCLMI